MSLADRLESSTAHIAKNASCQTCRFLVTLTQKDRDAVYHWADAEYNMAQLYRECQADGLDVGYRNFIWHFKRPCPR
jgi:hypothetical protein